MSTHYSDDELTLYYYGEGRHRARIDEHLRACAACAALYREIVDTLAIVVAEPVPERGEQYGLEVWQRIRHRLPEQVGYVTSPGNGDGAGWRKKVGLPRGGPSAVITTKAVLRFGEDGEALLASHHPGVNVEDVVANTGWKLKVAKDVRETDEPTQEELDVIRDYDKEGFWTK